MSARLGSMASSCFVQLYHFFEGILIADRTLPTYLLPYTRKYHLSKTYHPATYTSGLPPAVGNPTLTCTRETPAAADEVASTASGLLRTHLAEEWASHSMPVLSSHVLQRTWPGQTPMCPVVALCVTSATTPPPSFRDRPQRGQARVEAITIVSTYMIFMAEYSCL